MPVAKVHAVEKIRSGIPGMDHVGAGGLPKGRTCLVVGTAGSAKTVFSVQFLVAGIRMGEGGGVFVTFEESPADIRSNMLSLGWDIEQFESDEKWAFVDASPQPDKEQVEVGDFDLGALKARIAHAARKVGASRISMDSLGSVFGQFSSPDIVRRELLRTIMALKSIDVTAILTVERAEEYGSLGRHGIEEFAADNVIILRNVLDTERRRRTIEVLKFRGTDHHKGEHPFTIVPGRGIVVIPLSDIRLQQKTSDVRISSGIPDLDAMCGGGFFGKSVALVSGATGTGKTLLATSFVDGGLRRGERSLLFAFEESRDQVIRNARNWGMDFEGMEREGVLKIVAEYPQVMGLEDHLIRMKKEIETFKPKRLAVDSFSALDRVSSPKVFREFVIGLTASIKHQEIVGLFTATTTFIQGESAVIEERISSFMDSIILLRYVESPGEMRRSITVLKMRGSMHDKEIREYTIDGQGMRIGTSFKNAAVITGGNPATMAQPDTRRPGDHIVAQDAGREGG